MFFISKSYPILFIFADRTRREEIKKAILGLAPKIATKVLFNNNHHGLVHRKQQRFFIICLLIQENAVHFIC